MGVVDWTRYWRSTDGRPLEAMHAHFERHAYHRHSHETYSFGVTEAGAQGFTCRGEGRVSAAGMVMAFNPDDPHDGHAVDALGFTYRIVHIGPEVIAEASGALPLFADPVVADPALADALRAVHAAVLPADERITATALRRDELLDRAVRLLVRRGATRPAGPIGGAPQAAVARTARELLDARFMDDVGGDDLAHAAGRSRFAVYRSFRAAYGLAPSDYQRQLRLREARRLLTAGLRPATAAAEAGFADQAHLTRWFRRYYGITPAVFAGSAYGGVDGPS